MADIEQYSAPDVPADQLSILRHTLGVGEDGCARSYRNHFVTGEGGSDHALCMALVAAGLMTRHSGNVLTGGSDVFGATNAGRLAAVGTPPKLSRSQQRYREYLRTDSNLSFIEWLRSPYCPKFATLSTVKPPRNRRTRLLEDV